MVEKQKVKLLSIGFLKFLGVITIFSLIFGLFMGLLFFTFFEIALESFEINNIPLLSRIVLSFILVPLSICILSLLINFIFLLIINLILKIIGGIDLVFQDDSPDYVNKNSLEESYKLPEYKPNN